MAPLCCSSRPYIRINVPDKKNEQEPVNLLDLKPLRNLEWEREANGIVALSVPKFRHPFVVKWFVPLMAKPTMRVKLDAIGSLVWEHCDGATPVSIITEKMKEAFGEKAEPVHDRIGRFLSQLERDKFLIIEYPKRPT